MTEIKLANAKLALYPIYIYEAYNINEAGLTYSPFPWGRDTDRYKAETGKPDRVLIIPHDALFYEGGWGDLAVMLPNGACATIEELVDRQGSITNSNFGYTRRLKEGEAYQTAAELLAQVKETK